MAKTQGMESYKDQASGPNSDALKNKRFYALKSRVDQEDSPDVVTLMVQVFLINVYALINPDATSYFVTPLVSMKFDVLPHVFAEPFSVSTLVGDSVVAKRVYRSCPIYCPIELHWLTW